MFEGLQHHFGIGVAAKAQFRPLPEQLVAHLLAVVDFSVVDDHKSPAGGEHRLVAGWRKVNDGETPMSQRDTGLRICPDTAVVRPTMLHCIGHAAGQGLEFGLLTTASRLNETSQTTHSENLQEYSRVARFPIPR